MQQDNSATQGLAKEMAQHVKTVAAPSQPIFDDVNYVQPGLNS